MYRQQNKPDAMKSARCPECGSSRLLVKGGKLSCTNCGHTIGVTFNKYGAKRTEFNGKIYDSKYEASVAQDLETRKLAGDIKEYDTQYRVEIPLYDQNGKVAHIVRHKVDFRVLHNDDSYELIEAKGVITPDYTWRRMCLEKFWLPFHPDYTYTVVKQNGRKK